MSEKIVFIGSGNMAQAIIGGILKAGVVEAASIVCNDIDKNKVDSVAAKFGICGTVDKKEAVSGADIIFLSVKPNNVKGVLEEIKPYIKEGVLVISIAAGIGTGFIESVLEEVAVIRVMPNTPALVLCGASALCAGKFTGGKQLKKAETLFGAIGKVKVEKEINFDAVTALSGSGPAYVFYLCELMSEAGQKLGLDKSVADDFAAQTIYGAGKMLVESDLSAGELKIKVKSPNGTTQAALEVFEGKDLGGIVFEAMKAAKDRSQQLSK